jgi:hypothetical protein
MMLGVKPHTLEPTVDWGIAEQGESHKAAGHPVVAVVAVVRELS